jgi:4'-phosphopantetheinyl transferase
VIDAGVDIWVAHLDEVEDEMERFGQLLDAAEVERAARLRSDLGRRRFTVRRAVRRLLLATYLERPPQDLAFLGEEGQKPEVDGFQRRELSFNESASDGVAVFAIARAMEVGVDVERIRPVPDANGIVARFGSPTEAAGYVGLQQADDVAFLRWWTAKEAFVKMVGSGLKHPLNTFSVSFPAHNSAPTLPSPASGGGDDELRLLEVGGSGDGDHGLRLIEVGGNSDSASRFSLTELTPAPGYVATLIVAGRPSQVMQRRWSPERGIDVLGAA